MGHYLYSVDDLEAAVHVRQYGLLEHLLEIISTSVSKAFTFSLSLTLFLAILWRYGEFEML